MILPNSGVAKKTGGCYYQGRLMLFWGGGGNVYNVVLHVNAATLRGLTSFILCLI